MFNLGGFDRLRSAADWAAAKKISGKTRKELVALFLQFQNKPIPTSLTQLGRALREEATHTFKCILGFMGDAGFCYPIMLVQELISLTLEGGASLQTEVFVQLMKQLTENPAPASERLGWQLFSLLLQCYPPDSAIENYVTNFLRVQSASPELYMKLCYATIRRGPRRKSPHDHELPDMLTAVEDMHKALRGSMLALDELPPPLPMSGSFLREGQAVSGKL